MSGEADKTIDWVAIEVDYRAGIKTLRQIAEAHGVSHVAVSKRAKRDGWIRDLGEKIRQRTEQKVSRLAVSEEVNNRKLVTEKEVIEANSDQQANVIKTHRAGLDRLARLRDKLLDEVEAVTDNLELFQQLGEIMDQSGEDANGKFKADKQNEVYRKVIEMSERIDNTKKLAEIDEKVRKGQREAWGLDKGEEQKQSSIDSLLKKINEEAAGR